MIHKFQKKVNKVNLLHFALQVSWLAAFVFTLPDNITRSDLVLRLLVGFGGFTVLTFGLRHYYVQKSVRAVEERLRTTDISMHRMLGLFDDFYCLAEGHLDSIRRVEAPAKTRETLIAQADEMILRLVKTGTDIEKMKKHLRFEYLEKPPVIEDPAIQKKRQLESTYYYR